LDTLRSIRAQASIPSVTKANRNGMFSPLSRSLRLFGLRRETGKEPSFADTSQVCDSGT
jgi:hypothetical protein